MAYINVEDYVDGYDFRHDNGGGYTPNENEKVMLIDFAHGLIGEINDIIKSDNAEVDPADMADLYIHTNPQEKKPYTTDRFVAALCNDPVMDWSSGDFASALHEWHNGNYSKAISFLSVKPEGVK